jgi:hypothetical protein
MTWHTTTVPTDDLAETLAEIRSVGGTVTSSQPEAGAVCLTWTTYDHGQ